MFDMSLTNGRCLTTHQTHITATLYHLDQDKPGDNCANGGVGHAERSSLLVGM
jgi:hypothetical protein